MNAKELYRRLIESMEDLKEDDKGKLSKKIIKETAGEMISKKKMSLKEYMEKENLI